MLLPFSQYALLLFSTTRGLSRLLYVVVDMSLSEPEKIHEWHRATSNFLRHQLYLFLKVLAELGSRSSYFQLDGIATEMIHNQFAQAFRGKVITSRHGLEVWPN
jgi:hypothetical protein